MKKFFVLFLLFTNFAYSTELSGDDIEGKKGRLPSLPFLLLDSCIGEKCGGYHDDWLAKKSVIVYKKRDISSSVAFKLLKNEQFEVVKQLIEIQKYGKTKILASSTQPDLKRGETIYEIVEQSEGYSLYWHKNMFFSHTFDWYNDFSAKDSGSEVSKHAKRLSYPGSIEWVKIKNKKNQVGWTNDIDALDNRAY